MSDDGYNIEDHYYPTRVICTIFDEMRACNKYRAYGNLAGLIEEAQSAANRMEASLDDQKHMKDLKKKRKKLEEEIRELRKEKKDAKV